jgi:hypothetical protein
MHAMIELAHSKNTNTVPLSGITLPYLHFMWYTHVCGTFPVRVRGIGGAGRNFLSYPLCPMMEGHLMASLNKGGAL